MTGKKLNIGKLSKSPLLQKVKERKLPQTESAKPTKPSDALKHALDRLAEDSFPNEKENTRKIENAAGATTAVGDLDIWDFDSVETATAVSEVNANAQNYHYAEQADACDDAVLQTFYEQMHRIANSFDDPQLPYMLKEIREYLNEHEECQQVIAPEDIGLLVKALRASYKQAVTKKTAGNKKRAKANTKVDEIVSALDGIF